MSLFAHPESAPLNGPSATGSDTHRRTSESVSVAKLGLIGSLSVALVGGATTICGYFFGDQGGPVIASQPITQVEPSTLVSVDYVGFSDSDSEVTVAGSITGDVDGVYVKIGPQQSNGKFLGDWANLDGDRFEVAVAADSRLVKDYHVEAKPWQRPKSSAMAYTFNVTTAPPGPAGPEVDANCVAENGDGCFTGPGWGPPAVYKGE